MDLKLTRTKRNDRELIDVKLKHGMGIAKGKSGSPNADIINSINTLTRVAIMGRDNTDIRFQLLVGEGEEVAAGQAVMCDRRRPAILFTAPASGKVVEINRGPRRALISLVIEIDRTRPPVKFTADPKASADQLRQLMLQSGLWTCLRSRPFDRIPDPQATTEALLITAMDSRPYATDAAVVISAHKQAFVRGVESIQKLCRGSVYLCQSASAELPAVDNNIIVARFDGPHPAGLPGTHIHALCPVGGGRRHAWHIDYQDVISLGKLLNSGAPWFERVISISDPAFATREIASVPLGGALPEICHGRKAKGSHIVAGSTVDGISVADKDAFLGQRCRQISIMADLGRQGDGGSRPSAPLIPTTDLDQAAPPGILAVPFLRALLVGDTDAIRELGGLELVEEDLGLLSYLSTTGTRYGPLLRQSLDQLQKELSA